MNLIRKIFGIKEKQTSNKIINRFLKDSASRQVQLELFYNNIGLLQVQSLKYSPSWLERGDITNNEYKDGFVLIIISDRDKEKDIDKLNLGMIKYIYQYSKNNSILNYLYFFNKEVSSNDIENYIKKVIDNVYKLPEKNSKVLFNLRYLKTVKK